MSIYNEKKPNSNPFKTVMVEYFEDFESDDKKVTPTWSNRPRRRQIRVVTTTRRYNLGSTKDDPVVSVTYEYLQEIIMANRYLCTVLDEMRECVKTLNFSYLLGLIEEVQTLGNRME